jgi:hypothetical protein
MWLTRCGTFLSSNLTNHRLWDAFGLKLGGAAAHPKFV